MRSPAASGPALSSEPQLLARPLSGLGIPPADSMREPGVSRADLLAPDLDRGLGTTTAAGASKP